MNINVLYCQLKDLPQQVSDKEKWIACLKSSDDKINKNALYCAQQLLQKHECTDVFKELLYSEDDVVVQNTMHLLCNFASNKMIIEEIRSKGFKRLVTVLDKTSLPKQLYVLHFLANVLVVTHSDVSSAERFTKEGGIASVVKILSSTASDPQLTNLSLQIFSNVASTRKTNNDYSIFATKDNFDAFTAILKSTQKQHPNTIRLVLTILVNIVNDESNRDLFHESKTISPTVELLKNHPELLDLIITLIANVMKSRGSSVVAALIEDNGLPNVVNALDSSNERAVVGALSIMNDLATCDDSTTEKAIPILTEHKAFHKLLKHTRNSSPQQQDLKLKSVKAIKNLMTIESAQEPYKEAGGIEVLLSLAKNEKSEQTKLNALNALFHMTMFNDSMRSSVVECGLADLTQILASNQSAEIKKATTKSLVNMTLAGNNNKFTTEKTLEKLIEVLKSDELDVAEYSSMALENLAIDKNLNQEIAERGGVEASIDFLKHSSSNNNSKTTERSAKLLSRLAINGNNRKKLQDSAEVGQLISQLEKNADPSLTNALTILKNNMNTPVFETQDAVQGPVFPEFAPYRLDSDEEDEDADSLAPSMVSSAEPEPLPASQVEPKPPSPFPPTPLPSKELPKPEVKASEAPPPSKPLRPRRTKTRQSKHQKEKPPPPPDADPERLRLAKLDVKRTKVAYELLSTETTYCKNLEVVIQKFQNPLLQMSRSKKPLLQQKDIKTIFGSVEIIFGYNSILLDSLQSRMAKWGSNQIIGDIFLFMADCFKIYTDYINNFALSQQTLQNCTKTNSKFKKWLEKTSSADFCNGLSLLSFLITPVQRMPRYALLLRELKSATVEGHPDLETVEKAIQKIEYVNNYLNDKKRESEGQFKMIELLEQLQETDHLAVLTTSRCIEYTQSDLFWADSNHSNNAKVVGTFVIFSDAFMYTKLVKKKHKIVRIVDMVGLRDVNEETKEKLVVIFEESVEKKKSKTDTHQQVELYFAKQFELQAVKSLLMTKLSLNK